MRSLSYCSLPSRVRFRTPFSVGLLLLSATCLPCKDDPKGAAARIDAPFTTSIETPHVPWGKPSAGPAIHAFVVPSVGEGRTLIELAERMDLTFDTVMIDDAWDVNTWTVGTNSNYEARNYKLLYGYLTADLTGSKPYDAIVLPSLHGWNRLPAAAREAIRKRVEQGAGLVLIHPTTGLPAPDDPKVHGPLNDFIDSYDVPPGDELWDISPLVAVLPDRLDARGFREVRPDAIAAGPWQTVADHFVTRNVPFDAFPADYVKHYKYKLGKDSTALVTGPDGEPVVATKSYGRGRVIALGYLNDGLSPEVDKKILGQHDDHWWEYVYSLLCRSIIWAAKHEPEIVLEKIGVSKDGRNLQISVRNETVAHNAAAAVRLVNEWGEDEGALTRELSLSMGENTKSLKLPPISSTGRHYVDVILLLGREHHDWGTASFVEPKPDEITSLSTDRDFYAQGDKIRVNFTTRTGRAASFIAELFDNRGRLLARQLGSAHGVAESAGSASLDVASYTTNVGWVRLTLTDSKSSVMARTPNKHQIIDRKHVRVNLAGTDRSFGAYEMILPWYGPPSYEPWTSTLDEQFRRVGVTVVEAPERNFRLIQEVHAPGFGVYWHYREAYLRQKDKFLETGDKQCLIRKPDLASDSWLEELRGTIRDHMKATEHFRPLASYLADESSLTAYGDPLDFSWSEPTLTKFRGWLKTQYGSLEALNQEWGAAFQSWESVFPLTTSEVQAKGNYAGWMDHRTFMEQVFARALQAAADAVKQEDPGSLPSISGTQDPGPSNAVNWYLLDSAVDYLQPYSEDDQDELHRTMHPGLILTGFTGYERHGPELRHELWHRLLHGQSGASVFWQYTMLNADLTLTEQGRDLQSVTHELRDEGLALLLRGATRENCGIAVHYSLPSVRGQWITDGHIQAHELSNGDKTSPHLKRFHENRHAWLQALEDAGYQYDFLTTEQIEAGKLPSYRVLILPDSIVLSDAEVETIHKFARAGGFVIADAETGLMDGHARWQEKGRLDDLLGVERSMMRSAGSDLSPVSIQAGPGPAAAIRAVPADPTLRAADGQTNVKAGDTPVLIEHRLESGHALTLNFWMSGYDKDRGTDAGDAWRDLLRRHLAVAGVRPAADVATAGGRRLACSEVVAYKIGGGNVVAILPEPKCRDAGAVVSLRLTAPKFVYDLRQHRSIGHVDRVSGTLTAGEPLVYALRDSAAARPAIARRSKMAGGARQGEAVKFDFQLIAGPATKEPSSALHIEVRDPRGEVVDYYGANVAIGNGHQQFAVPLALNDAPGRWRVTVREPFAHQTAAADFLVTSGALKTEAILHKGR